ncbi:hypothetical protein CAAN1_01S13762 [[Candida] anglica]|uniref:Uncharacterized protein n=1 Tax=[Candida] anglica TaxID=148631 RepID=A0ABP0EKP1_9ASCO
MVDMQNNGLNLRSHSKIERQGWLIDLIFLKSKMGFGTLYVLTYLPSRFRRSRSLTPSSKHAYYIACDIFMHSHGCRWRHKGKKNTQLFAHINSVVLAPYV